MRQNQFVRHCCSFLMACILVFMMSGGVVYAQESYTVEVGNQLFPVYPSLYSSRGQVMVPLKGLTEALGGIYLDLPMGSAQETAILNDRALILITGMNVQLILPLNDYPEYTPGDSMDDYLQILLTALMDGSIPIDNIKYSIVEKDGDIYLPLEVFASSFDLSYSIRHNTISFEPNFITYGGSNLSTKSTVTFRLRIPNKVYDGKPLTWSEDMLEVFCNGERITDYLPLSYDYQYTDMRAVIHSSDGAPINAGTYLLTITTDSRDPKYTGTGYVSFIIEQAELMLTAKDTTISVDNPLPTFSYEVSGIVPGDTRAKALTEEPILSIGTQNINQPGAYEIVISGGSCGNNYTIVERNNGILTVLSGKDMQTIRIRCVERASGRTIRTIEQQGTEGSILTISAPALEGYFPDQSEQQVTVAADTVVTFYYDSVDTSEEETLSEAFSSYISGFEDGTFRPQNNMKRNECAVMLYRLLTEKVGDVGSDSTVWRFHDMRFNTWYDTEVCTLAARGIITGYQDGTFLPERTVSRAEFVVMALRFAEIVPTVGESRYSDVSQTHWAANYIQTATQYGLISGYSDGTFRPEQYITRAEAVTILNKISGRTGCTLISKDVIFPDVPVGYWAYADIMLASNACK